MGWVGCILALETSNASWYDRLLSSVTAKSKNLLFLYEKQETEKIEVPNANTYPDVHILTCLFALKLT